MVFELLSDLGKGSSQHLVLPVGRCTLPSDHRKKTNQGKAGKNPVLTNQFLPIVIIYHSDREDQLIFFRKAKPVINLVLKIPSNSRCSSF